MATLRSFDGTAKQLVFVAGALIVYVLGVSIFGSRLALNAVHDSAQEAERVDAYSKARTKLDAVFDRSVRLAQEPSSVRLASVTYGFQEYESAADAATEHPSFDTSKIHEIVRHALASATRLASARTPAEAEEGLVTLTRDERQLDTLGRTLSHRTVIDKMQGDAQRLWLYGLILPTSALLGFLVFAGILVPRALKRIRRVNSELMRLQAESAAQAAALEERNAELSRQQALLQENQSELIVKTEELEGTSMSSQAAARRFEELFQGLPVACVGFAEEGLIYEWNRASTDLFGFEAFEVLGQPVWQQIADRAFRRKAHTLTQKVFRGEGIKDMEWTVKCKGGEPRRVMGRLFPMRGLNGRILGAVLACIDVTERHQATQELRASEKLFRDLIDSLHEGVVLYDGDGRAVIANRQATNLLACGQSKINGLYAEQLYPNAIDSHGLPFEPVGLPVNMCKTTGEPVEGTIIGLRRKADSPIRWLSTNVISLRRPDEDKAYGVLSSFSDVTERLAYEAQLNTHVEQLAQAHEELQERQGLLETANSMLAALAITDGLTGLYNHRAFQERLEQALAESVDGTLSVILVDVDHFKAYNDSFGHPEGDRVLRQVANALKEGSGEIGIAARYGGEEFAIIAPGLDAKAARKLAEKLCHLVAGIEWPNRQVTISAGIATVSRGAGAEPASLIRLADEALYASKRNGRNRATHIEELPRAA